MQPDEEEINEIPPKKNPPPNKPLLIILCVFIGLAILLCAGIIFLKKQPQKPNSSTSVNASQSTNVVSQPLVIASSQPVPTPEPPPAPVIPKEEWYMALVNSDTPLPDGFDPATSPLGAGYHFDERAIDSLKSLLAAAEAENVKLKLVSGYRSFARQKTLYNAELTALKRAGKTNEEAEQEAQFTVQKDGESEHNLGLAADILAQNFQRKVAEFEETLEFKWLTENAAKYGFILRYPKDKTDITGVEYKPWHFRYVGEEQARLITDSGLCLEEYLAP